MSGRGYKGALSQLVLAMTFFAIVVVKITQIFKTTETEWLMHKTTLEETKVGAVVQMQKLPLQMQ